MAESLLLLWVLAVHFIADFACQPRYLGINKSSKHWALLAHVAIYGGVLWLGLIPTGIGLTFVILNCILHLITDFVSSRLTTRFYKEGRMYAFWNTIAADQFAHIAGLILLLS
ncbi:MAG: DUF3307 domain-containing protein [Hydrogenophaga sp.]|uniref:DUF3307 domain-containing protein n=1 Tax=Hydrogenophaga sp. TaxID=1904254 RepID=UPI00345594A9|nr:DUF3307 domain-containing protein [Hydrogenophaga sp.]